MSARSQRTAPGARRAAAWRWAVLVLLVAAGASSQWLGWWEWAELVEWSRRHAASPWLPLALIVAQALLYTFAMPGSSLIWPMALLYPPMVAAVFFVCGSTLGAIGAYSLADRLSAPWREQVRAHRAFRMLRERGDFSTLAAVRVLPGFPHSVINYSAGLLALPRRTFVAATMLGMALKSFLYAQVVHSAASSRSITGVLRAETVVPLALVFLLLVLAHIGRRRWEKHRPGHERNDA